MHVKLGEDEHRPSSALATPGQPNLAVAVWVQGRERERERGRERERERERDYHENRLLCAPHNQPYFPHANHSLESDAKRDTYATHLKGTEARKGNPVLGRAKSVKSVCALCEWAEGFAASQRQKRERGLRRARQWS
jgi:hypothetical protein